MFKRVLVLVIFLFGVFWWLTSRDNEPAEPNTDVVIVETENVDADGDVDGSEEEGEAVDAEGETSEEETTTPATVAPEATTDADVVVTVQPQPAQPTAVATVTQTETTVAQPVVPVVPAPVRVTPKPAPVEIPDRTTDVKVYMYEWGLDMSDKSIPAGTINFKVQNDGRFTHDFNVAGFGNLGKVMPSEKTTFTVKLAAGEYEAFSERRQDYERGVRETFAVVK